jgi:hypothetical protein
MKINVDKIIGIGIISVVVLILNLPTIWGMMFLIFDLTEFGFEETCSMCIKTLQNIASSTGYSYGFWNVLLFIIIEPLLCVILWFTTLIKSHKVRYIIAGIIALIGMVLFNYLIDHYILCSKSFEMIIG